MAVAIVVSIDENINIDIKNLFLQKKKNSNL